MELNSAHGALFPAHYNHLLMDWRRRELGLSIYAIAELINLRYHTIRAVFQGVASSKSVYPVAELLRLDWAIVHDLTLRNESDFNAAAGVAVRGAHLIAPEQEVSNSA